MTSTRCREGGGFLGLRHQQDVRLPYHPGVRLQHSHNPWNLFVVSIAKLPGAIRPVPVWVPCGSLIWIFWGGIFCLGSEHEEISVVYLFPWESFTWGWNDVIWFDLSQLDLFWILSIFHSPETIRAKTPKTNGPKHPQIQSHPFFKGCLMWDLGGFQVIWCTIRLLFSLRRWSENLSISVQLLVGISPKAWLKIKLLLSFNRICVRLTPEEGEDNIPPEVTSTESLHMNGIESSSSLSWSSSICCGFWKCCWLLFIQPLRYPYILWPIVKSPPGI